MGEEIEVIQGSPVQMRQALEMVAKLREGGINFIPLPVLNELDREKLLCGMNARLEALAIAIEEAAKDG